MLETAPQSYRERSGGGLHLSGKLALRREEEPLHVDLSIEYSRVREKVVIHVMIW